MSGIGGIGNTNSHMGLSGTHKARHHSSNISAATVKPNSSGSGDIKFSGQLRLLNRRSPQLQAEILSNNFSLMMNNADSVNQIKHWLGKSVTYSASTNSIVAGPMLKMIRENKEMLKDLSKEGADEKHAVAGFLTEALRSYNFAHHDSAVIKEFIGTFKEMDIPIHGNPDSCATIASFAGLDYLPGHGVVMQDR